MQDCNNRRKKKEKTITKTNLQTNICGSNNSSTENFLFAISLQICDDNNVFNRGKKMELKSMIKKTHLYKKTQQKCVLYRLNSIKIASFFFFNFPASGCRNREISWPAIVWESKDEIEAKDGKKATTWSNSYLFMHKKIPVEIHKGPMKIWIEGSKRHTKQMQMEGWNQKAKRPQSLLICTLSLALSLSRSDTPRAVESLYIYFYISTVIIRRYCFKV